ncbi:MAG: hydrogenase maturation nickel metallochaperone HypA [candidate division WOR-3 bacterium]
MHELAITQSMLNQVLAVAREHGAVRITTIRLLVGEAAGVVPDCVQFYFDQMKQGTCAADAKLEFRAAELRLRCPACGSEFSRIEGLCSCNAGAEVVSGQELAVESIEVE